MSQAAFRRSRARLRPRHNGRPVLRGGVVPEGRSPIVPVAALCHGVQVPDLSAGGGRGPWRQRERACRSTTWPKTQLQISSSAGWCAGVTVRAQRAGARCGPRRHGQRACRLTKWPKGQSRIAPVDPWHIRAAVPHQSAGQVCDERRHDRPACRQGMWPRSDDKPACRPTSWPRGKTRIARVELWCPRVAMPSQSAGRARAQWRQGEPTCKSMMRPKGRRHPGGAVGLGAMGAIGLPGGCSLNRLHPRGHQSRDNRSTPSVGLASSQFSGAGPMQSGPLPVGCPDLVRRTHSASGSPVRREDRRRG
jgi:hypothetical protein